MTTVNEHETQAQSNDSLNDPLNDAVLFEAATAETPELADDQPPRDPRGRPPPTKPMVRSKTFWATVLAALTEASTQAFEAFKDWRLVAALIVLLLLGYILWERNGKPDIRGWLR
jgi:hypothetical protein